VCLCCVVGWGVVVLRCAGCSVCGWLVGSLVGCVVVWLVA
jgi:hypothetical protein